MSCNSSVVPIESYINDVFKNRVPGPDVFHVGKEENACKPHSESGSHSTAVGCRNERPVKNVVLHLTTQATFTRVRGSVLPVAQNTGESESTTLCSMGIHGSWVHR